MAESQTEMPETTDDEIVEWTSDELARQRDRCSELRRLMTSLPGKSIEAAGFHWSMLAWLTDDQRFQFLNSAWRSDELLPLMGAMARDVGEFIIRYCSCYSRPPRDNPWDEGVDRPRDPWMFEPAAIKLGNKMVSRTIVERHGIFAELDEKSSNGHLDGCPILRFRYLNQHHQEQESNGWAIEVNAEVCVTPLEDFSCPTDATITIGYRSDDGRIDVKVWAKEMPGSPVLHWIFPDPKNDELPLAYRDFLWWL